MDRGENQPNEALSAGSRYTGARQDGIDRTVAKSGVGHDQGATRTNTTSKIRKTPRIRSRRDLRDFGVLSDLFSAMASPGFWTMD